MDRKELIKSFTETLERYGQGGETPNGALAKMLVTQLELYKHTVEQRKTAPDDGYLEVKKDYIRTFVSLEELNKQPAYVEAVQFMGNGVFSQTPDWLGDALVDHTLFAVRSELVDVAKWVYISMIGTTRICRQGDWIVRDESGELSFAKTSDMLTRYTEAEESVLKYRKKPVVIEAMQTGDGKETGLVYSWLSEEVGIKRHPNYFGRLKKSLPTEGVCFDQEKGELIIYTLEGPMRASQGDWVIKGVAGEFYPCKPDIFEQTYDHV